MWRNEFEIGKEVIAVSNLAEGIFEEGLAKGHEEGRKATIIKALKKNVQ